MPWKRIWIEPKVFLQYAGKTIYHAYEDDDDDEMLST